MTFLFYVCVLCCVCIEGLGRVGVTVNGKVSPEDNLLLLLNNLVDDGYTLHSYVSLTHKRSHRMLHK